MSDLSEEEEIKIPPKDLTGNLLTIHPNPNLELDRLVYVVYAIENDCAVSPVGAFKLTPTHQVRRNEAFKGLDHENATQFANYLHFRNVQNEQYKEQLDQPSAPFNAKFLEPITEDLPKGLWTL